MTKWAWGGVDSSVTVDKFIGLWNQRGPLLSGAVNEKQRSTIVDLRDFGPLSPVSDNKSVFQNALREYTVEVKTYTPSAPSLNLYTAPILKIPSGIHPVSGAVTSSAAAIRMELEDGAIIKQIGGTDTFSFDQVARLQVVGGQFCGGARPFYLRNNNLDGSSFSFFGTDFNDTTDYPITAEPTTPNTTDGTVNHISGVMTLGNCRFYNTNGMFKTYMDLTSVGPGCYATLYSPVNHGASARFATNRPAMDVRSKGDGVRLNSLFGVALCRNGLDNHRWIDLKPGNLGDLETGYAGGTGAVSGGGGVYATGCRFGNEEGGIPIVWNYVHGLGRSSSPIMTLSSIVFEHCGQLGGGSSNLTGGGVVVLKQGIPQVIRIIGNGPEDHDVINSRGMLDLAGGASSLAYWMNAARSPNPRLTVEVIGPRSTNAIGAVVVPTELLPYAVFDVSEDGSKRQLQMGSLTTSAAVISKGATVTYSASITIDASLGNRFTVTANNGTAFTINAPTSPTTDQEMTLVIRNTSGGALGAITWNAAFKMAAWTSPATANSRSIRFSYDGTNWVETTRAAADVPN